MRVLALAAVGAALAVTQAGSLTQTGCVSAPGRNARCAPARALRGPADVVVSPDGRNVYVASTDAVAVFARDARKETLTQLDGTAGCVSANGSGGSCSKARAMHGTASISISGDGRNLYAISTYSQGDGISVFARNPITGALRQLAGTSGCVSANGTGGVCATAREFMPRGSLALSPDGRSVYVVTFDGVDAFARDPATGTLTRVGCVTESGSKGACVDGRGLLDARVVAVSPDGRNVYVAGGVGDSHSPTGNLAILRRDRVTGALTQPAGSAWCLSETDSSCSRTNTDIEDPGAIVVPADGRSLYLGATRLVAFVRNPTGALRRAAQRGFSVAGLALSPDSRTLYATAAYENTVWAFARGPSGRLTPAGCVAPAGRRCTRAKPLKDPGAVAVSRDGRSVYVVSSLADAVLVFDRRS